MIRYREFAISAASIAGLSLSTGCTGGVKSLEGDWTASSLITGYGALYDMPFSFDGSFETAGFGGTYTYAFNEWSKRITLKVDEEGGATMDSDETKDYSLTIDYGYGYDPYVYDVVRTQNSTFKGTVTKIGDRAFDIVLAFDSEELVFTVNGEDQLADEEPVESPTERAMVLQCATDEVELHCTMQDNGLIVLEQ